MNHHNSQKLFELAKTHIPGGVDSPVRAFKSVGGNPLFIARAKGASLFDVDGNEYVDYVGSWGPAILGHAPVSVLREINETMKNGLSFGAPTAKEIRLAELVKSAYPVIELVRFVNSGTEATMSAIRVARGFTKKDKIIKFDGCYHGHADFLLVKAGSGATTLGAPDSAGVPEDFAKHTLVAEYNNIESVKKLLQLYPNEVAAVIVEPVVGNMGCIPPSANFLKELRELTKNEKVLLIFDEVMTGFRVAWGGASELYNIKPDLITLGKIIGGGLPVGAYGGRQDIMEQVAPLGPVYQAGTLSGNPLAMASGIATLEAISKQKDFYAQLEKFGARLVDELRSAAVRSDLPVQINRVGSMLTLFFTNTPVTSADSSRKADSKKFSQLFHCLLNEGIYWPPSAYEAAFFSIAHTNEDLEKTVVAFEKGFKEIKSR